MNKLIIGLIILLLSSCVSSNNGFTARHKKKKITLLPISDQVKIGYETEKAIIYIGKKDAISLTERLLSNKGLDPRFDKITINDLQSNLDSLKLIYHDFTVQHWMAKKSNFNLHDYNFAGFIDQWILKDLILKGNAEVVNKAFKENEERVTYHFVRDRLGGKQCYYTFENGIEFHRQIIALGE